jgi:hypothetical protein
MAEIYIPNEQYNAVVNTIAEKTGGDPDEIKIALGEEGNIWPENNSRGRGLNVLSYFDQNGGTQDGISAKQRGPHSHGCIFGAGIGRI